MFVAVSEQKVQCSRLHIHKHGSVSIGCFLPGVAMSTQEIAELAQALTETRQELVRLHGVQAAAAAAIPVGGGSVDVEKKLESIIDTRIINKIGVFSGYDGDCKQWCFVFESTAGLVDLDAIL